MYYTGFKGGGREGEGGVFLSGRGLKGCGISRNTSQVTSISGTDCNVTVTNQQLYSPIGKAISMNDRANYIKDGITIFHLVPLLLDYTSDMLFLGT